MRYPTVALILLSWTVGVEAQNRKQPELFKVPEIRSSWDDLTEGLKTKDDWRKRCRQTFQKVGISSHMATRGSSVVPAAAARLPGCVAAAAAAAATPAPLPLHRGPCTRCRCRCGCRIDAANLTTWTFGNIWKQSPNFAQAAAVKPAGGYCWPRRSLSASTSSSSCTSAARCDASAGGIRSLMDQTLDFARVPSGCVFSASPSTASLPPLSKLCTREPSGLPREGGHGAGRVLPGRPAEARPAARCRGGCSVKIKTHSLFQSNLREQIRKLPVI